MYIGSQLQILCSSVIQNIYSLLALRVPPGMHRDRRDKCRLLCLAGMKKSGRLNITGHLCDLPAMNYSRHLIIAFIPLL
jgi:hypothetical protein